jgi:hypothetical protein
MRHINEIRPKNQFFARPISRENSTNLGKNLNEFFWPDAKNWLRPSRLFNLAQETETV